MLTPDQVAALQSNASAPQSFTGQKTKWVNGQLVLSNPPAEAKKKKGFWEDQISTGGGIGGALAGGAAGAAIGSVVPVIGTAIGGLAGAAIGGFAGGAGGQAIENKVTGSDDNIWKEGAINSALSLPPVRLLKGALVAKSALKGGAAAGDAIRGAAEYAVKPGQSLLSKFTSKASGKLKQAGDDIAVKSLGLTKGQKNTLLSKTGEKASDIVGRYGIKTADDIPAAVKPLFDEYSSVLSQVPGTISREQISKAFQKAYAPMLAKGVPTGQRAIGEKLKAEADNLLAGVKEGGVTAAELNGFKQAFDKLAYKLKASDPGAADINKLSRDALNNLLDDFTTQSGVQTSKGTLKGLGAEINKLASLDKLAKKNIEGAGGHTALGLTPVLGSIAGGGAAGLPGVVAGGVVTKIANSAKGQRAIGDALEKGSSILSKFKAREVNPLSAGKTVKRMAVGVPIAGALTSSPETQSSDQESQAMNIPSNMSPSIDPMAASIGSLNTESPQNATPDPMAGLDGAIQQALAAGDYKGLGALLEVANYYEKRNASGAGKPLSAEASKVISNANSGLESLRQVRGFLNDDPNVLAKTLVPGRDLFGGALGGALGTSGYETASRNIMDVITRLRTGAAITENEEKFYRSQLPQAGDPPEVREQKLQLFEDLFSSVANRTGSAGTDLQVGAGY